MAFYGIQEANGFEPLRLRREFSLMSCPEALHYRDAALKYSIKRADKHQLLDVLGEIGAEMESFHAMLEASFIAHQLADLRLTEADQFLLYGLNLPDKVMEYAQLHCGVTTAAGLWEAVTEFNVRMRVTGDLERVHGSGQPKGQGKGRTDSTQSASIAAKRGIWARIVGILHVASTPGRVGI
eukprot:s374_g26.t1